MAARILLVVGLLLGGASCAKAGEANAGAQSLLDEIKKRGVLKVGSRVDNPPHSSFDEQGRWVGFDNDIAAAIAKRWGVKLEMVKVDELTRISFLQNGKVDLSVASISKTRKRGDQVDFSQTYFHSVQTFVVRKNTATSYKDLVGKRVGASRGSSSIGNWKAWLKRNGVTGDPEIEEFGDKRAALAAVKQGAIAGWTEDYEVLASYARNEPDLTVLNVPGGTGVKLDGIAMRKNDSTLRNAVDLALQDIMASGEYDQMYDRWFGPSSTAPVPRQGSVEVWPNG
ncbi:transporter substrate-binding domain-containing protein [Virgisporangium ochraceum]|uniref:transporter substrate-binding domain-containing protein n=1 Tax=Virgisporangium ochraceum TaxID=65505 RepID=UPI00194056D6|nr:transporter substrate-binding domain-containing protein [Virgisporangium ochraceum]